MKKNSTKGKSGYYDPNNLEKIFYFRESEIPEGFVQGNLPRSNKKNKETWLAKESRWVIDENGENVRVDTKDITESHKLGRRKAGNFRGFETLNLYDKVFDISSKTYILSTNEEFVSNHNLISHGGKSTKFAIIDKSWILTSLEAQFFYQYKNKKIPKPHWNCSPVQKKFREINHGKTLEELDIILISIDEYLKSELKFDNLERCTFDELSRIIRPGTFGLL